MSADLLATIVAATRRIVAVREASEPLEALAARAAAIAATRGRFEAALVGARHAAVVGARRAVPLPPESVNIIAECKRRSPSRGVLRAEYDPVAIARGYADAGAAAISVLTEPTFFDGSLEHLSAVRGAVDVPVLRKDFIVSEYQLHEARVTGADAVLLIVAALGPVDLTALHDRALQLGLDVLVEVHDAGELQVAVGAGARIIGVNNRNLRTLDVDVHASESLIARMPSGVIAVSESGLRSGDDLMRLRELGYHAFLIGERFMVAEDPGATLKQLLASVDKTITTKDTKDTKVQA
jgi:indole-3-glycerol phosphate synthase